MKMIMYRANMQVAAPMLPFYLRATGWHTAKQGWTESNLAKDRDYSGLFWCMTGSAKFTINDKSHQLDAGQILYYLPYESHFIEIISSSCTYYWLTFDGPLHVEVLQNFKYPRTPFAVNGDLVTYFDTLFEILHDLTPAGLQHGSQALYDLLIALGSNTAESEHNTIHQQLTNSFIALTSENFKDKSYNVNVAADMLKVHRTTLTKVLNRQLHIKPSTYIINIRLQYALKMLHETNLKVAEIADACGIHDPCYFSKLIKQLTGLSPYKLRNNINGPLK